MKRILASAIIGIGFCGTASAQLPSVNSLLAIGSGSLGGLTSVGNAVLSNPSATLNSLAAQGYLGLPRVNTLPVVSSLLPVPQLPGLGLPGLGGVPALPALPGLGAIPVAIPALPALPGLGAIPVALPALPGLPGLGALPVAIPALPVLPALPALPI